MSKKKSQDHGEPKPPATVPTSEVRVLLVNEICAAVTLRTGGDPEQFRHDVHCALAAAHYALLGSSFAGDVSELR
jgi:hypothetical protein